MAGVVRLSYGPALPAKPYHYMLFTPTELNYEKTNENE